ncbi:hypothetical protein GGR50DRAFT_509797 [Xylaria sp. CBS 124048]|nr:hypothetical protein GGR50DRAFT_509797 [Xylaria sp. CBS 124048]
MATTTIFDSSKSASHSKLDPGHITPTPESQHLTPQNGGNRNPHSYTNPPKAKPVPLSEPRDRQSPNHDGRNYRLLGKSEWLQFCRGVGILKDEEGEEVIRVTSRLWPPSGFRDGLYNDILSEKTKFTYYYHALSIIAWLLMLLQIALSAILTALGATSKYNGTVITIIAAINTSLAGILALLHNSGLPDRYRYDRNEFYKLEEHIKAVVDTGLVPIDQSVNDAVAECFDKFATALQTVQNNNPTTYTVASSAKPPLRTSEIRFEK